MLQSHTGMVISHDAVLFKAIKDILRLGPIILDITSPSHHFYLIDEAALMESELWKKKRGSVKKAKGCRSLHQATDLSCHFVAVKVRAIAASASHSNSATMAW